jgi:hypothetical protein
MQKWIFLVLVLLVAGCLPQYTVFQDSNPAAVATAGQSIFVSWLPLDPNSFAKRRYRSAGEYTLVIADSNEELQKGLRARYPKKRFIFAKKPNDGPSPGIDVAVLFEDPQVRNEALHGYAKLTIQTTVKFFDAKAQREIRSVRISATTSGMNGWLFYNQEAALDRCAYNVGAFVGEALADAR